MPKSNKHLSKHERDLLSVLKSKGHKIREIARALGRAPGTISRELKRNVPPINTGYNLAHKTHDRATQRAIARRTHQRLKNDQIRKHVKRKMRNGWSPELIAGRLKDSNPELSISHEAIYQWLYCDARDLIPLLVRAHKNRKRRGYSRRHKKTPIPRESVNQKAARTCSSTPGTWTL